MRIVQLSDIHLSKDNRNDLTNFYLNSLISDLSEFHSKKPIDIILFTGDLVDRGGSSLGTDPYSVFFQLFANPIKLALDLKDNQILFIPGNHDIDRNKIYEDNEYYLSNTLTEKKANEILLKQKNQIQHSNERIEKFKTFESKFHENTDNYVFSLNESLVIYDSESHRFGFALINDSWRCSQTLTEEKHFIGSHQLFNAKVHFSNKQTDINIAVFHHPMDAINSAERDTIQNILKSSAFNIAFFGHSHQYKFDSILSPNGGYITIRGRSAFYNYDETESKYQPGYNIIDINVKNDEYTIYGRKFILEGYRFDKDVESFKDGQFSGKLIKSSNVSISRDSTIHDIDLPGGYEADVEKVVKLLIGKSLYPDPYTFVRELIQNSVDACKRVKDKYNDLTPQISVHINIEENSFEITDEGDGMSKKIIREHFSIIGKSISQEYINSNNTNLISQFGIGFISTFIVAERVLVQTKSEDDDLITFAIDDVFQGFNYEIELSQERRIQGNKGTYIKVYLKKDFHAAFAHNKVSTYCRHINNFSYFLNGKQQVHTNSWNIENGIYSYEVSKFNYKCKIAIGNDSRALVASNGGFFVNTDSPQIIPFLFPYIIGGEVVFEPKHIDLDLSRTNIIQSEKSNEFRKDISIYLVMLFRDALESTDSFLSQIVIDYLQFYLINYDNFGHIFKEAYLNFYSKIELIKLCSEKLFFEYNNELKSLTEIIFLLKSKGITKIYANTGGNVSDLKSIVGSYLRGLGNLIVNNRVANVPFRDGNRQISTLGCVQIIASYNGLEFIDLDLVLETETKNISVDKSDLSTKAFNVIDAIERKNSAVIEVAHLGVSYNKYLIIGNRHLLNYDNNGIRNVIMDVRNLDENLIEVYLLGILGLDLNLPSIS